MGYTPLYCGADKKQLYHAGFKKKLTYEALASPLSAPEEIAILCGSHSRKFCAIDFDNKNADGVDIYTEFMALLKDTDPHLHHICTLASSFNPESQGYHIYFYDTCEEPITSKKIARKKGAADNKDTLIETRGEGGYIIIPNILSKTRTFLPNASLKNVPFLSEKQIYTLLNIAALFNEVETQAPAIEPVKNDPDILSRYQSFMDSFDFLAQLQADGYKILTKNNDRLYLSRPGKKARSGNDATYFVSKKLLYPFGATHLPESEKNYNAVSYLTHTKCNSDKSEFYKRYIAPLAPDKRTTASNPTTPTQPHATQSPLYSEILFDFRNGVNIKTDIYFKDCALKHPHLASLSYDEFYNLHILPIATNHADEFEENNLQNKVNPFSYAQEYISKHFIKKYDTISDKIIICDKETKRPLNINDHGIYVQIKSKKYGVKFQDIKSILSNNQDVIPFNPIQDFLESIPEPDFPYSIESLTQFIQLPNPHSDYRIFFNSMLYKMMLRIIEAAIEGTPNREVVAFCSTTQGIGKTSFIHHIHPFKDKSFFIENKFLTGRYKGDDQAALAQNIVWLIDELHKIDVADHPEFKSTTSQRIVKVRNPFERDAETTKKRVTFIGTSDNRFLPPTDQNTRWICLETTSFDYEQYTKVNMDYIWYAVYQDYKAGIRGKISTDELLFAQSVCNPKWIKQSTAYEIVRSYIKPASLPQEPMSTIQIMEHILSLSSIARSPKADFTITTVENALFSLNCTLHHTSDPNKRLWNVSTKSLYNTYNNNSAFSI